MSFLNQAFQEMRERKIRYVPLEAKEVPKVIKKLCSNFNLILEKNLFIDLLAIAGFVLDFLCIHPFRDGNGRVSRLLTLLLLYKCGYQVGSFISLERIIESTKEDYYETLKKSSQKWHSSEHDPWPFFHYFIGVVREGYRELTDKVSITEKSSRGGKTELLKREIISQHTTFTLAEISSAVKTASLQLIKKVLRELKKEGQVKLTGRGRGAVWQVIKR